MTIEAVVEANSPENVRHLGERQVKAVLSHSDRLKMNSRLILMTTFLVAKKDKQKSYKSAKYT